MASISICSAASPIALHGWRRVGSWWKRAARRGRPCGDGRLWLARRACRLCGGQGGRTIGGTAAHAVAPGMAAPGEGQPRPDQRRPSRSLARVARDLGERQLAAVALLRLRRLLDTPQPEPAGPWLLPDPFSTRSCGRGLADRLATITDEALIGSAPTPPIRSASSTARCWSGSLPPPGTAWTWSGGCSCCVGGAGETLPPARR